MQVSPESLGKGPHEKSDLQHFKFGLSHSRTVGKINVFKSQSLWYFVMTAFEN